MSDAPRDELVRQADQARSRLMRTVDELEVRGREVLDLRVQLRRHLRTAIAGAAILLVATGFGLSLVVRRRAGAARRRWRDRWRLVRSGWRHPDRTLRSQRGSLAVEVGRSVALSLLSAAAAAPGKRLVAGLFAHGGRTTRAARSEAKRRTIVAPTSSPRRSHASKPG